MEATLNYSEKLWTESLDMVNSNLIKMYNAQGEFEGALNSIGGRQNELIRFNASVTPQKYPRIFIIILLYIMGMI